MHGESANLLRPIVAGAEPSVVIDPSIGTTHEKAGTTRTSEAFLPTEMDFALTALWSVDRPGPWMAIYPLR
jgi:hypothetical protein